MSLSASIYPFFKDMDVSTLTASYIDINAPLGRIGEEFDDDRVKKAAASAEQILRKRNLNQAYEHHRLHVYLTTITQAIIEKNSPVFLAWSRFLDDCQRRSIYYPDGQEFYLDVAREKRLLHHHPLAEVEIDKFDMASKPADFESMISIDMQSFTGIQNHYEFLMSWITNANAEVLLAREKGTGAVLGFLMYTFDEKTKKILLVSLGRTPDAAKLNIGEKLLQSLKQEPLFQASESIYLHVRESNQSAIALYQREGFTTTKVEVNFYTDPKENGLEMTLVK